MEQLLHYQVEQKRIFSNIKLQISQNIKLSTIIQVTIERVRNILNLDRLLIYQLNIPQEKTAKKPQLHRTVNQVTYEVKSSSEITSVLDFQAEKYLHNTDDCWLKYRQGFTLAINDIETANLNSCLRDLMAQLQVKATIVIPMNTKGKLWGLLIAHQCHNERVWDYHETQFIQKITEYLAIAVEQSQSYEKLHQQKQLLEKQVKNQAQQIENALIAARVASQSKHEFLGTISHELKTPLTRVIGLSGTLLHWSLGEGRTPLPMEKQQQYLKTIQDSGKHLLKLINTILEFSEVQSGKHLLNAKNFFVLDLCEEIITALHIQAHQLVINLKLDFQLDSQFNCFYGDRERLGEILLNLLDNALKFTPAGGEVCLRVWQEKKQIIFEVEDTGVGISEQQLPLLFETFKPLEHFRQRIHEGAGIGLALTKHLVELHGGSIDVESTLGKGSVFRVSLPTATIKNIDHHNQKTTKEDKQQCNNKVVLITKDEDIATFICEMLTAADYKVVWLIDTATALEQIDFLEPKIIILDRDNLDIEIPDVTDAIKAIERIEETKVILLYSQMESEEWSYFLESGVSDRIVKSIDLSQLISKIEG